ncbi:MAG: hypothetical protein IPL26_19890 [Leptospiraceae bacterium]|nr:hypothetical protein [Leptospiraceae bacterium]
MIFQLRSLTMFVVYLGVVISHLVDACIAAKAYGFPLEFYLFLFSFCIVGVVMSFLKESRLLLVGCFLEFFLAGLLAIGNGKDLFDLEFSALLLPVAFRILILFLHYISVSELVVVIRSRLRD